MTQQRVTFEWRIGETEYDLWSEAHPDVGVSPPDSLLSQREQQLVNHILRICALLTVIVLAANGMSYSPRQLEWERAQTAIRTTIDRENRAWWMLDRDQFLATVDPAIESHWANEWRSHWRGDPGSRLEYSAEPTQFEPLGEGLMRVSVAMREPAVEWSHVEDLEEIRFYRETDSGWVRTVPGPDSEYWGERQGLQTGHLRFIYHARDAEAVEYAAPRVAAALTEMYRLLAINPPAGYETITIELVPERMSRWAWTDNHLQVSSPTFSTVPAGLTPGEDLAESLVSRISYRIFNDATEPGGRFLFRWTVMNWGLRRWMANHLLDQPSPWHDQAAVTFRAESAGRFPLSPAQISDSEQPGRPAREFVVWRFLAAETIIDYGVQTYGEETLPALFRGFARYGSWDEMIQTVYGVDAATFAAGWNAYLAERFDLSPPSGF